MEKTVAVFAVILFTLHFTASALGWYWSMRWFDMPMHFLGGALAALIFFFAFSRYPGHIDLSRNFFVTLILVLGFTALIGVLWEFFEFLLDAFVASRGWMELAGQGSRDMLGDLFFDLLGGMFIALVMRFRYNNQHSL